MRTTLLGLVAILATALACSDDGPACEGANCATDATLTVSLVGSGRVTSSPAGIDCGATCSARFARGTAVTLTAAPAVDATFVGWSGGCTGTGLCVVTLEDDRSVAATFAPGCTDECSAGATRCAGPEVETCGQADADACLEWSAPAECPSGQTCAADACAPVATLTVVRAGPGSGTVTSTPAGLDCGATCAADFAIGTVVSLTATPAPGASFAGWSGACTGLAACAVTVTAAATVTATFAGACSDECPVGGTQCVDAGREQTCGNFDGDPCREWSGPMACAASEVCAPTSCVAGADVTVTTTAGGRVVSTPTGIDCGADCAERWPVGTSITLTPTPTSGYFFSGWSGGPCATATGACTFTLATAVATAASFAPACTDECAAGATACAGLGDSITCGDFDGDPCREWGPSTACASGQVCLATSCEAGFRVTLATVGHGEVTAGATAPCVGSCDRGFPGSAAVPVVATPAPYALFTSWSGACAGTGACSVATTASVTATFTDRCVRTILDSTPSASTFAIKALALDSSHLYWIDIGAALVKRRPLSGSTTTVIAGGINPASLALDATHAYWSDIGERRLYRWPKAGGTPQILATLATGPDTIALTATHIYWVTPAGDAIYRMLKDGGTVETVVPGLALGPLHGPHRIAVDADAIYWLSESGTIARAPLVGGTITTLATGQDRPSSLFLTSTQVYWSNRGDGTIARVAKTGGAVTVVATSTGREPAGLFVDGTTVGWTHYDLGADSQQIVGGAGPTELAATEYGGWGIVFNSSSVYVANGREIARMTRSATCWP
jgi:hypothetical protein